MSELAGRKVLITGALGTLGQALVARYSDEGAYIVALDRPDAPEPEQWLPSTAAGGRYVGWDLNDLPELQSRATRLADELDGIDVLVNNAALVIFKQHDEFTLEEYEDQVRVNSSAAFVLSRACSKHMRAKLYGKIVNITSLTLTGRWDGYVPYIASKGAMYGLIKGMARELGPYKAIVLRIDLEAKYSDINEFLRWLETNPRLMRVDSVKIDPTRNKGDALAVSLIVLGVMG